MGKIKNGCNPQSASFCTKLNLKDRAVPFSNYAEMPVSKGFQHCVAAIPVFVRLAADR